LIKAGEAKLVVSFPIWKENRASFAFLVYNSTLLWEFILHGNEMKNRNFVKLLVGCACGLFAGQG